jgi:predicted MFS family arabinose efflux permease
MVFIVSFVFAVATVLSLWRIRDREIDPQQAHGAVSRPKPDPRATSIFHLLRQRSLLIFAATVLLLQLANAAMLPLMAGVVTARSSASAPALIAASIIVPQAMVALISPSVGRKAQSWGRRPLLMLAFAALALRGSLFSMTSDPSMLVVIQALDGITAAVFGVMVPLIVADITYGSGHFNLAQGIVGTATGIGASLSPALAGYASDHFGHDVAFMGLAAVAMVGLAVIWTAMPETKTSLSQESA